MQIMPTNSFNGAASFFSGTSDSHSDFMSAMETALSGVDAGDYLSADSALADTGPLVESPYTKHTTDGVTYTMSEVLFTKEELGELRTQLLKEGAPVESLKQFDILADQPNGATLAQVMASLIGRTQAASLNEEDIQTITAFLGQIDPTGDLASQVLAQMRQGNGMGALDLIQGALGKLDASDLIDIDLETAGALGRGLGLNADSMRLLGASFGGFSTLRLNGDQFDTLMNPAKNQLLQEAGAQAKLDAALDKTLKPIIAKARNRMEKEKLANEKESRRVQQSRVLIDRTVQGNSRDILDQTVARADDALTGKRSQMTGHAGEAAQENLKEAIRANASNSKSANNAQDAGQATVNAQQTQKIQEPKLAQNGGDGASEGKKDNGWNDLFAKIETRPLTQQGPGAPLYANVQQTVADGQILPEAPLMEQTPLLPSQLASQVEQGLLTAMRDGASRLDLQLHPAELGSVAITLIARNGEVTALLRSEKPETAEMMQRQIDTMRVNLEQQGVRVDKIEVQLENHQDNFSNAFQDLGQHNARQEEEARRQELARLRNLAAVRGGGKDDSVLAQSVQSMAQTARYAGQALHVVA